MAVRRQVKEEANGTRYTSSYGEPREISLEVEDFGSKKVMFETESVDQQFSEVWSWDQRYKFSGPASELLNEKLWDGAEKSVF